MPAAVEGVALVEGATGVPLLVGVLPGVPGVPLGVPGVLEAAAEVKETGLGVGLAGPVGVRLAGEGVSKKMI